MRGVYRILSLALLPWVSLQQASAEPKSDHYLRQIALQREIARSEGRISDLRKERDARLRQLRVSDEAGAAAEGAAAVADEAATAGDVERSGGAPTALTQVAARYDDEIKAEQIKLQVLQRLEVGLGRPDPLRVPARQ